VRPFNILITAGSRRVPLVQGFRTALRSLGLPGVVIVTDVNPLSPAVHVADRAYRVPMSSDPAYIDEVQEICALEQIRLVIPTIDDELPIFAAALDSFRTQGIYVACSPEPANTLCNDKLATCRHLRSAGVSAARSFDRTDLPDDAALPLFIKPRTGRGAVGAFPVRTPRELEFFLDYVPDPIVQEYLDGPEFTIDVLCDDGGRPLSIVPRERVVIRAGVIDRGRTVNDPRLIILAEEACRAIRFAGPINIQCRMRGNGAVIFEINPRFSGGIPLTIQAGADFPQMLIRLALGRKVEPQIGEFRDQLWMTSFETSFFLDASNVVRPGFDTRIAIQEVA
jgi:carbamoyl-phosphate synthase large subunit